MRAAGIDVGKTNLDLAMDGQAGVTRFANGRAGIGKLLKRLQAAGVERIVVEATGGAQIWLSFQKLGSWRFVLP